MKLAILETDTPVPAVDKEYGSYGQIFDNLLRQAGLSEEWQVEYYDVISMQYPALETTDAFLITGSKHNSYDNDEWILKLVDYTNQAMAAGKRMIGVCYGHQIIGRALGAKVGPSENGWETSVLPFQVTDVGRKVLGHYGGSDRSVYIMQMHKDVVFELPPNCQLLGSSDKCKIQGFYRPDSVWSIQGHPEFTQAIMQAIVTSREEAEVFDKEMVADAWKRSSDKHQGPELAKSMVQFLNGEL